MPINLSEQQKQIGKDNFHEAVGVTRRDFLIGASAGAAAGAIGLGATYFGYKKLDGNPVKVGWIGTGLEGSVLLNEHPANYLDVVTIADLHPTNRKLAFEGQGNDVRMGLYEKLGRDKCKSIRVYNDHKELLADKDIEAVVIAVPLNQHAPVAIEALEAGKHVLCEKLMAYNIDQCKEMIAAQKAASKKYKRPILLAIGHQRHYSVLYDNANHLVKQGLLGDIKHIRASWHRNNSFYGRDSWRKTVDSADQKAIDQARAQNFGYEDVEQLVNWRLYNATGGGLMAELGSHQLDAASIFLGKVKPLAVQGYGGRNFYGVKGLGPSDKWTDNREVDDHVYTTFEFPGKYFDRKLWEENPDEPNDIVIVTYSSLNTNGQEPYGEVVFGSRGTLMMLEEKTPILYKESMPDSPGGFDQRLSVIDNQKGGPVMSASESLAPSTQAAVSSNVVGEKISRGYTEEMEHFAYCIRHEIDAPPEEGGLRCNGSVAMADAIMALTSNLAMKHRKRIVFKEDWFNPDQREALPEEDEQVKG